MSSHYGPGLVREEAAEAAQLGGNAEAQQGQHKQPGLSQNGLRDSFEGQDEDPPSPSEDSTEDRPGMLKLGIPNSAFRIPRKIV